MKYLIACKFKNSEDNELESVPNSIYNIDPDAICLFDSVWLLVTELSTEDIHASIRSRLNELDLLVVTPMHGAEISGPHAAEMLTLLNRIES